MVCVEFTDLPPTLTNFLAGRLQNCLVGNILPQDEVFDDPKEPLTSLSPVSTDLFVGDGSGILMPPKVFRVVYQLTKDYGPRSGQRPTRPPAMQV